MNEWVTAAAPSNIALIKYMGKQEVAGNVSTNASLSFTLDHLQTRVRVRFESGHPAAFVWRPLKASGFFEPLLSERGEARFLAHADRCLKFLSSGRNDLRPMANSNSLVVESANGFPSDCGLASSASSFAALTLAVAMLAGEDTSSLNVRMKLAELSRQGSGSSCRSFFSPWAIWKLSGAVPVEGLPEKSKIRHLAVIVDAEKKAVSSSEAHVRVASSLLFHGRVERAEERLRLVLDQLKKSGGESGVDAWNRAAHIVWAESWDMHALFESSEPPFGYFIPESVRALNIIRDLAGEMKLNVNDFREPMVTMDAGPNVHVLLWNDHHTENVVSEIKRRLGSGIRIIDSMEPA
jgi:diphosphomevalonate decarboxylase